MTECLKLGPFVCRPPSTGPALDSPSARGTANAVVAPLFATQIRKMGGKLEEKSIFATRQAPTRPLTGLQPLRGTANAVVAPLFATQTRKMGGKLEEIFIFATQTR